MLDESQIDDGADDGSSIRLTHNQLMDLITKTQGVPQPKAPKAASPFQAQQPMPQSPQRLPGLVVPHDPNRPVSSLDPNAYAEPVQNATARTRIAAMEAQKQGGMAGGATTTMSVKDAWKSLVDQNPKATPEQLWATIDAMGKAGALKPKDDGKFDLEQKAYQAVKASGGTEQAAIDAAMKAKRAGSAEEFQKELAKKQADLQVKTEGGQPKALAGLKVMDEDITNTLNFLDMARKQTSGKTTGLGAYASSLYGTGAHNLAKTLSTITSNFAFDKLQELRANSPTGSALGRVTNQEMTMLQNSVASLDQGQTEDQLRLHYDIAERILKRVQKAMQEDYDAQYKQGSQKTDAPTADADPRVQQALAAGYTQQEIDAFLGKK